MFFKGIGQSNGTFHVYDLVDSNGDWDWHRLRSLIPKHVVNQIKMMSPHASDVGPNQLVWKWMAKEDFSSSKTYRNLCCVESQEDYSMWKLIWKIRAPQRVRVFIWLFWQN